MKEMSKAATAMIGIICVQMIIAYAFSWHAAELFSKMSLTALSCYYVCKAIRTVRKRKAARNSLLS